MKNSVKCLVSRCFAKSVLAVSRLESQAAVDFYDNFDSYANGNLVGQGTWAQTSTTTTRHSS